jgi:hypothetical protein
MEKHDMREIQNGVLKQGAMNNKDNVHEAADRDAGWEQGEGLRCTVRAPSTP